MPYKLTVDLPNLGGQEIYIHGLGSFGNGSYVITDEQAAEFQAINTQNTFAWDQMDEEGKVPYRQVSGPDLVTAASTMYGVTVERTTEQPVDSLGTSAKVKTPRTGTNESGGEN